MCIRVYGIFGRKISKYTVYIYSFGQPYILFIFFGLGAPSPNGRVQAIKKGFSGQAPLPVCPSCSLLTPSSNSRVQAMKKTSQKQTRTTPCMSFLFSLTPSSNGCVQAFPKDLSKTNTHHSLYVIFSLL